MSPRSGPVTGDTFVSVTGRFPTEAHVWFGDLPGTTFAQTDTWIVVRTPATDAAGVVDLTVRTNSDGVVITVEEAFAYLADDGGGGPAPVDNPGPVGDPTEPGTPDPGTPGGGQPGTGDPAPGTPGTGTQPDPGPGTTTPGEPGDPGNEGGATAPDTGGKQTRPTVDVEPFDAGNGLRLRRLDGLDSLADLAPCQTDPCPLHQLTGT
ncbi:MAG: IPT/TIG domain-containing protein [Actinomycetota bacterium]